ncbi:MAG: molybdenum cofactor biosynthesis protein [Solirubrobacteraceae bacterium]
MQVRVRLFAQLRERAGTSELELELPPGACVSDALAAVGELAGGLPLVMAINREYAEPNDPLAAEDELALIPPVSGGAVDDVQAPALHARVTGEPLSDDALLARVRDPRAGAVVVFHGVTREVERLEYEAYAEMASERIAAIVAAAAERHGLCAAAAEHRVGVVALGEPSVTVAVSAPHREQAFAGAREIIDAIKAQAPIWKKQVNDGGSGWVPGHPPRS